MCRHGRGLETTFTFHCLCDGSVKGLHDATSTSTGSRCRRSIEIEIGCDTVLPFFAHRFLSVGSSTCVATTTAMTQSSNRSIAITMPAAARPVPTIQLIRRSSSAARRASTPAISARRSAFVASVAISRPVASCSAASRTAAVIASACAGGERGIRESPGDRMCVDHLTDILPRFTRELTRRRGRAAASVKEARPACYAAGGPSAGLRAGLRGRVPAGVRAGRRRCLQDRAVRGSRRPENGTSDA